MRGTEFCCTMKSERENRKDAIVIAGVKEKADALRCVVCLGYKTHEEERGKENCCTCDRFSADGFRTRAARVIRWLVLGVRATKGGTERGRAGRTGDSRTRGKTGKREKVVQVIPWRGKNGVCV